MYMALKHSHLTLIILSLVLLFVRVGMLSSGKPLNKFLKIYPHINDTLLIVSAITLSALLQQYPFVSGWLTLKLAFVITYFVCVFKAIKAQPKTKSQWLYTAIATFSLLAASMVATSKFSF